MAVITQALVTTYTGVTFTGADATAVDALALAVDAALKRMLRPFYPEPVTVTDCILDAPLSRDLYLPVTPVRSVTSVYYNSGASGVVANFTATYLLDNTDGAAYELVIDDKLNNYAKAGLLRRVNRIWGASSVRPPQRLAYHLEDERGSVKATFAAGPIAVPKDIELAAGIAVVLMFQRRKEGAPFASESWNGRSQSIAGPFTAESALRSPDCLALLMPYLPVHVG